MRTEVSYSKPAQQITRSFLFIFCLLGVFLCGGRCPPCRAFTPRLVQTYKELKKRADGNDVEFIYVSSDKDQSQFDE